MENGAHFDVAAFETAVAAAAAVAAVSASNSYEFVQNEQVTGSEELREESDNHLRKVSPPNTPDFGPVVGDVHPDVDEPKEVVASDDDEHGSSDSNKGALVEDRVAKNRERNREHARRTRLRKKEQLKRNQQRLKDLEQENRRLKLNVEECKVASILLGMASASKGTSKCSKAEDVLLFEGLYDGSETKAYDISKLVGKRKRFVSNADEYSEHPSKGSKKSQINWKSGVMYNENGEQRHLSASELDSLRYVYGYGGSFSILFTYF